MRAAGGVGRIKQIQFLDGVLKLLRDDGRLDDGDEIFRVDLQNPVHAFERENNSAANGNAAADVAVAAAARGHGDFIFVGEAQNRRDGFGGAGQGDGVGLVRGEPFVAGIIFQGVGVKDDFAGQDFFEPEQF